MLLYILQEYVCLKRNVFLHRLLQFTKLGTLSAALAAYVRVSTVLPHYSTLNEFAATVYTTKAQSTQANEQFTHTQK